MQGKYLNQCLVRYKPRCPLGDVHFCAERQRAQQELWESLENWLKVLGVGERTRPYDRQPYFTPYDRQPYFTRLHFTTATAATHLRQPLIVEDYGVSAEWRDWVGVALEEQNCRWENDLTGSVQIRSGKPRRKLCALQSLWALKHPKNQSFGLGVQWLRSGWYPKV